MVPPIQLLRELMLGSPFQPATNLWRAVELDAVLRHGLPIGRGLDLGCGDGKLTTLISRALGPGGAQIEWVGVDLDPAETAQARASGLYARVHTGSAALIPEPDACLDFVFSNSVLEHIGPIDEVLAEASRLLKPGGRFICTVPGPQFHECLAGPWWPGGSRPDYEREIDVRCAHLRYWSDAEWAEHLQSQGLVLEVTQPYLSQRQVQRWEAISAWTGGLAYRVFGRHARPIEIQRRLQLRNERPGFAGRVGALSSRFFALGCPLDSAHTDTRHGCLLLDARKTN